jgi:3-hydroxyacyl-[acyl-carrier-protein] dehydratase
MNRDDIERSIPHRAPFLWIDEVVELSDKRIHARKFLDPALDVFQGHYPGFPVLPGVLQCEAAFQAGALLISKLITMESGQVPVVTRLNNTQFRRLVRPGETLDIEVELTETLSNAYFLAGKVSVGGKVSTRLEFACTAARVE